MKPALSIILFTTIAGAAQGMVVALALATLAGMRRHGARPRFGRPPACCWWPWSPPSSIWGIRCAPWRTVLMWRTSWMSREVIVLPAFIALVGGWALLATLAQRDAVAPHWLAGMAIVGAVLLWYCTAMIYACIRFIQEWAHPLTVVNYTTLGLASGFVTGRRAGGNGGGTWFASDIAPWALAATALAWFTRTLSLRRNARLKPKSTTQTATASRRRGWCRSPWA